MRVHTKPPTVPGPRTRRPALKRIGYSARQVLNSVGGARCACNLDLDRIEYASSWQVSLRGRDYTAWRCRRCDCIVAWLLTEDGEHHRAERVRLGRLSRELRGHQASMLRARIEMDDDTMRAIDDRLWSVTAGLTEPTVDLIAEVLDQLRTLDSWPVELDA